MTTYAPSKARFMDEGMRALWARMQPMPEDLRLYGGTAIALYLAHRHSTDFDFATPLPAVDVALAHTIPWLDGAQISGGPGMVDAVVTLGREIKITLMETGTLVPHPRHAPVAAPNGVAVAHPADLIAAKLDAYLSREEPRDILDIAHCANAWPKLARRTLAEHAKATSRNANTFRKALLDPPAGAEGLLTPKLHKALARMSRIPKPRSSAPGADR